MSVDPDSVPRRHRCAVLGSPISHSRSPALHRAAYAALGLDWQYDAIEVSEGELPGFVAGLDVQWRGLSLTMPLKTVALPLCSSVDGQAERVGAVNTMVRSGEGGWDGFNTDVGGCVDVLRAVGLDRVGSGLIVGAGATAASGLAALADLGAGSARVLARSVERAAPLVALGQRLGVAVSVAELGAERGAVSNDRAFDVLVSTIPAAAQQAHADDLARCAAVVLDVVYDPPRTPLLTAAERAGAIAVPGLDLLLRQAVRQVELMTGVAPAPIEAMQAALH